MDRFARVIQVGGRILRIRRSLSGQPQMRIILLENCTRKEAEAILELSGWNSLCKKIDLVSYRADQDLIVKSAEDFLKNGLVTQFDEPTDEEKQIIKAGELAQKLRAGEKISKKLKEKIPVEIKKEIRETEKRSELELAIEKLTYENWTWKAIADRVHTTENALRGKMASNL
jgi:hypothetical protein